MKKLLLHNAINTHSEDADGKSDVMAVFKQYEDELYHTTCIKMKEHCITLTTILSLPFLRTTFVKICMSF